MARTSRGGGSTSTRDRNSGEPESSADTDAQKKAADVDDARGRRREDGRKGESEAEDFEATRPAGALSDGSEVIAVLQPPPPGDGENIQRMVEEAGWQVAAVDWAFEQVTGESLVEKVIMPITGDFNKIQQNAEAWITVGNAVDQFAETMQGNAEIALQQWQGEAATAHGQYIEREWKYGLMVEAQVAKTIAKGFTAVAEGSQRLCAQALDLLKWLVDKVLDAIAKAWIPLYGWVKAAEMIWDAYQLFQKIMRIIEMVKEIIENVGKLWDSLKSIGSKLGNIKEINSVGDVTEIVGDVSGDVKDVAKAGGDIKDGVTDIKHTATGVKDTARQPSQTAGSGKGRISGSIPPE